MTNPESDREKILVLETKYHELERNLMKAEVENSRLVKENMGLSMRKDQRANKSILTHLVEIIKIMLSIIVVLAGAKYGLGK